MFWDRYFEPVGTCKEFKNHLDDLVMVYRNKYPLVSVIFDDSMMVGEGDSYGADPYRVRIGVKDLDLESDRPIREKDFTAILTAFYHEMRHVEQYDDLFRQENNRNSIMAISYLADMYNDYYYRMNYFSRPYEIDAMQIGIQDAYAYCSNLFGEKKANRLICDFVNCDDMSGHNFLSENGLNKKYTSVYDILDDYDKVFIESIYKYRDYDLSEGLRRKDIVANYFYYNSDFQYFLFIDEPNGLYQDKLVAATMYFDDLAEFKEIFPGVKDLSLSDCLEDNKQRLFDREKQKKKMEGDDYVMSSEIKEYYQRKLMEIYSKREQQKEQRKIEEKLKYDYNFVDRSNTWIEIDSDELDNDDKGLDF